MTLRNPLLLLTSWWLVWSSTVSAVPYHVFVILTSINESNPIRGTSIRIDGRYVRPSLPLHHPLLEHHPIGIQTDNESSLVSKIDTWMVRECTRRRLSLDRCYLWQPTFTYSLPALKSLDMLEQQAHIARTLWNQLRPCSGRSAVECTGQCTVFGTYGCQARTFCGFTSVHACEFTGYCRFDGEKHLCLRIE
jgi:hypothetical protein